MWVQLKSIQYIEDRGKLVTYHPGDWVNVGKQLATLWLSRGEAIIPQREEYAKFGITSGSGLVYITDAEPGPAHESVKRILAPYHSIEVMISIMPQLAFEKTIIMQSGLSMRVDLIPVGLNLLNKWEIAVPLWDYDRPASKVGREDEREKTRQVIHDDRVPLYDTRLMFVRKNNNTDELFGKWRQEVSEGAEEKHAFLRSLYTTPMLLLALPITWTNQNVR